MADPGQPTLGGVCREAQGGAGRDVAASTSPALPAKPHPSLSPTMHPREAGSMRDTQPARHPPAEVAIGHGSISLLSLALTCRIPSWPQGVFLGSKGEEALLGTIEPNAGLLEAIKVSQRKSLIS